MSRRGFGTPHPPDSPQDDQPTPTAGRRVRLPILSWAQAGLLAALVGILIVFTSEPTPENQGSPTWAARTGHPHRVQALAFAPDGRTLATTGGDDGAVILWEVGRGAQRELRGEPPGVVLCVGFSPDGATLATGGRDTPLTLWDVTTGSKRSALPVPGSPLQCLDF